MGWLLRREGLQIAAAAENRSRAGSIELHAHCCFRHIRAQPLRVPELIPGLTALATAGQFNVM
jgi:hypothetical protein